MIDSLQVRWSTGKIQNLYSIKVNQELILYEKDAEMEKLSYKKLRSIFSDFTDKVTPKIFHKENIFNDFNREPLMPYMLSKEGPAVAVADINSDGYNDFYMGSSSFNKSRIFMGGKDENYHLANHPEIYNDSISEDIDAVFFDADNDKDLDLYVVSGGNEFPLKFKSIEDRLYILNDEGIYERDTISLPRIYQNGSVVRKSDFDKDGDLDLFVAGRVVPGRYGLDPKHYLLENNGEGKFSVNKNNIFENVGMLTDAIWVDIDNNGWEDLVLCGDWSEIKLFMNEKGKLKNESKKYNLNKKGWWFSIQSADINNDGFMDLIAGNIGLNNKLKASKKFPVKMYINDFDNNNSYEQIITYTLDGKEYPMASKDELIKQLNYLKRDFLYYKSFAGKEIDDIFLNSQLTNSKLLNVDEFQSHVFINKGNEFEALPLPLIVQSSSVNAIETCDYNLDNNLDLLLFGNNYSVSTYFGSFDANHGILLKGHGDGTFSYIDQNKSGLNVIGETKKIFFLDENKTKFVLGKNDNKINFYKLNDL